MTHRIGAGILAATLGCVSGHTVPVRLTQAVHATKGAATNHPATAIGAVTAPRAAASPAITRVSLTDPSASTAPQDLTVEGAQFLPALLAMVTDPAGNVRAIESGAIEQVESATFHFNIVLEMAGEYSLVVVNPDGHLSNACAFQVGAGSTLAPPNRQ